MEFLVELLATGARVFALPLVAPECFMLEVVVETALTPLLVALQTMA
jgi:hypothetical protein